MLSLFDPTLDPTIEAEDDPLKLIPIYRSPKVQGGFLPGTYQLPAYLHHQQQSGTYHQVIMDSLHPT